MQRTITFTEAEDRELQRRAAEEGVSVEELLRQVARQSAINGASEETGVEEAVAEPSKHATQIPPRPELSYFDDRTPEERARDDAIHRELERTHADFETRRAATREMRERHDRQIQAFSQALAAWYEETGLPPRPRWWKREDAYEERLSRYYR